MKEDLKQLVSGQPLSRDATMAIIERFMLDDSVSDAQIGAYLFATAQRKPTGAELVGGALALRAHMKRLDASGELADVKLLDTCGTGGSGFDTFNTSTVAAFVVAACGQHVAKHGNRGATSRCGSADLLEALGVNLEMSADTQRRCLLESKFSFFFAPHHHSATKRVAGVRKQLGFRTLFNFLGPLSSPADVAYQLHGVSDRTMMPVIANALKELGTERALVVRGQDGIDEISLCAPTEVIEIGPSLERSYTLHPSDFGFSEVDFAEVAGFEAKDAAACAKDILAGDGGKKREPYRNLVLLNAGAALYISGRSETIAQGIEQCVEAIDSGKASKLLEQVVSLSNS